MTTTSEPPAPAAAAVRHPDVAVLVVIFTVADDRLQVLLIERSAPPEEGLWAVPGGRLELDESLDHAAVRKLAEEAGVTDIFLEQLYTFGDLDRSSEQGSVAVAWFALVDHQRVTLAPRTAWRRGWFPVDDMPELAFDNERVIETARERLINKLEYTDAAYSLLPKDFTMRELQRAYEAILGRSLDKRNFRRRIMATEFIAATDQVRADGPHRPARLYRFSQRT